MERKNMTLEEELMKRVRKRLSLSRCHGIFFTTWPSLYLRIPPSLCVPELGDFRNQPLGPHSLPGVLLSYSFSCRLQHRILL